MMLKTVKATMDKHINYGAAFWGALVLGGMVYGINVSHGVPIALVAATKQATYTFFVAGLITRNNDRLVMLLDKRMLSLLLGILVSSSIAIGLTYLVHSLRGTPEPFNSTIPTMVLSPVGFLFMGILTQRQSSVSDAKETGEDALENR